jgi:dephospho-CoA kinase
MALHSKLAVVGLTGGIGSGKSTVAAQFALLGIPIVDTDAIAHALTVAGGKAMDPIRLQFGSSMVSSNGGLDRPAMRRLVFGNTAERSKLEALLHPLIREESASQLSAAAGVAYAVLMVPLLFETMAFRAAVQRTLVVDCPVEMQIERVRHRSGLAQGETERIISSQIPRGLRLQLADDVLFNGSDSGIVPARVETLHRRYLALAGGVA